MRLYFTRHGESQANRLKIISNRDLPHPLTEKGRLQALALAERLRGKPILKVYSSPLLRARQTGELLSAALSVPLELVNALREPDTGIWEGRGDVEAWVCVNYWVDTWLSGRRLDQGPEGGETYNAIRKRVTNFIWSLVENFGEGDGEFVIVTHGAAMLFSLPGLVEGLGGQYFWEHGLGFAECLCVDYHEGKLINQ